MSKNKYIETKIEGKDVKVNNLPSDKVHYEKGEAKSVYLTSKGDYVTEDHRFVSEKQLSGGNYNNYNGKGSGEPSYKKFEDTDDFNSDDFSSSASPGEPGSFENPF